ncbi:hypothetical protein HD806DRAFT_113969 [Xylariaceae sp. AK1471]|nr:hypothetical protein HD806DRAFT_113969 [Xylariaceae sp. AK1471]
MFFFPPNLFLLLSLSCLESRSENETLRQLFSRHERSSEEGLAAGRRCNSLIPGTAACASGQSHRASYRLGTYGRPATKPAVAASRKSWGKETYFLKLEAQCGYNLETHPFYAVVSPQRFLRRTSSNFSLTGCILLLPRCSRSGPC